MQIDHPMARDTDLVPAAHTSVHCLPLSTARELWRRRCGDRVEHGGELGIDLPWAPVEELKCWRRPFGSLVVDDRPRRTAIDMRSP